ncbi:hypothetical protein AVEN_147345-1 [Araneus ventricosus]|uniref:DDE-1 domain-containing protein n=1 Tax=Araneus ventricosus TaxID=182803 RepID=A0A4Y2NIB8_ARAVE|nr:hypothetical protein AVEN_147345-1 [Araneus ventricosus]
MCKEKRKIVLFIDNCTADSLIPEMNAVKVVCLSPNMTSKLQPLDQGIIINLKVFYRKEFVKKVMDSIDKKQKMKPFNKLDCMKTADRAWMNITQKIIKNCFEQAGFSSVEIESDEKLELHRETQQCEEWEKVSKILNLSKTTTFEKFTEFDLEVQVCGMMTRSFLKRFLRCRVMRKRWIFQLSPTLLQLRLKMLFTCSDASWNVKKMWKKRTLQLFFGLKTW